jgi:hypothetical protein
MNSPLSRVEVEVELGASKQTKKTSFIAFYQFKFLSFLFSGRRTGRGGEAAAQEEAKEAEVGRNGTGISCWLMMMRRKTPRRSSPTAASNQPIDGEAHAAESSEHSWSPELAHRARFGGIG